MAVKYTVELTSEERAYLEALVGKGKPTPAWSKRLPNSSESIHIV